MHGLEHFTVTETAISIICNAKAHSRRRPTAEILNSIKLLVTAVFRWAVPRDRLSELITNRETREQQSYISALKVSRRGKCSRLDSELGVVNAGENGKSDLTHGLLRLWRVRALLNFHGLQWLRGKPAFNAPARISARFGNEISKMARLSWWHENSRRWKEKGGQNLAANVRDSR